MIVEKIYEAKQRKIKQYPVNANRASELGHECLRYLVLNRTRWQEKTVHNADLQLVFEMGNAVEALFMDDLREAGIRVVEQQRAFSWAKYQITGAIDAKVAVDGGTVDGLEIPEGVYPADVKSSAPNPFASVNTAGDMIHHKYHYMRKYPAQLLLYMLMDGKEWGVFLFKNKVNGKPKEIWLNLDYEFAERLVQKAELINLHVENETLPECMPYNEDICDDCAFVHICLPDRIGKEVEISDSTELLDLVTRYMELKPGAKEYDEVNNRITKLVEGNPKILIGDFFIEGKYVDRVWYDIPADVKLPFKGTTQSWQKKIMRV